MYLFETFIDDSNKLTPCISFPEMTGYFRGVFWFINAGALSFYLLYAVGNFRRRDFVRNGNWESFASLSGDLGGCIFLAVLMAVFVWALTRLLLALANVTLSSVLVAAVFVLAVTGLLPALARVIFFAVILVALPVIVQHEEIGLRLKQAMGGLLKFVLDKFAL